MRLAGWVDDVPEPEPVSEPEPAQAEQHTTESARAALDAAGVAYDKRWGLAKLLALIPGAQ